MSVLEMAIGWLAPAECVSCGVEGSALCEPCNSSEILPFGERCFNCGKMSARSKSCDTCRASGIPNYVWVSTDYERAAKDLIQKYKFVHQRAAAVPIANIMIETFLAQNSDQLINRKNYLVVPVPTAGKRIRQRSFDHTFLLAERIARQLGVRPREAVGRLGHSRQVGAPRAIRAKQAKGNYYVKNPKVVAGRNILLIDDVVTTGATLCEVAKVLRAAGARSVDALVLAKRL